MSSVVDPLSSLQPSLTPPLPPRPESSPPSGDRVIERGTTERNTQRERERVIREKERDTKRERVIREKERDIERESYKKRKRLGEREGDYFCNYSYYYYYY